MLTNENLLTERPHPSGMGGVQRIYRMANGYGLSLINMPIAHAYSFAWEAAVLKNVSKDGREHEVTYDTELTSDVVVFDTDEETNTFIERAFKVLEKQ